MLGARSHLHFATSTSKSSGAVSLGHEAGAERVDLSLVATLQVMDGSQFPSPPDPQSSSNLPAISSFFSMYPSPFQPYAAPLQEQNHWYTGLPPPTSLTSTYSAAGFSQEQAQSTTPQPPHAAVFPNFMSSTFPLCDPTSFLPDTYYSAQAGPPFPGTDAASSKTYTSLLPGMTEASKEASSTQTEEDKPDGQDIPASVDESPDVTDIVTVPRKHFPAIVVQSSDAPHPVFLYNIPTTDRCYSFSYSSINGRFDMYFCKGCYESEKKSVVLFVSAYFFQGDPAKLEHVCTPKVLIQEISNYTGRKVKLPLTRYLVVQKVINQKVITKQDGAGTKRSCGGTEKSTFVQSEAKNVEPKPASAPLCVTYNGTVDLLTVQCTSKPRVDDYLLEDSGPFVQF
ncbi:hypothetical protein Aduo_019368 [Ancylostoma duodenale]